MIWNRADLKARGKQAVHRNYWSAVLAALVMTVLVGMVYQLIIPVWGEEDRNYNSVKESNDDYYYYYDDYEEDNDWNEGEYNSLDNRTPVAMTMIMLGLTIAGGLVSILLITFLGNPLIVGGSRFFLENREFQSTSRALSFALKEGRYGNVVKAMFWRDLYIFLWSFLLIVPGIYMCYVYRMVPYLLAENPHMNHRRALELSKQMMNGHKMETFILDLSFMGWIILSYFTCGLLVFFYVSPYIKATDAELYAVLRTQGFKMGYLNTMELPSVVSETYQPM